jgi:demethylmenaquinone methyltransferase/2-methoxy-6-polyprenyl-1,4-benzoquinol methylase
MRTDAVTRRYEKAASGWAAGLARLGYDRAYRGFLAQAMPAGGGAAVCDMGAGAGDLAIAYLHYAGWPKKLVLVDPSAAMLAKARQRLSDGAGRARLVRSRLEEFDAPEAFDIVMAAHLIEHCANPVQAMGRLAALARAGGRVVLVVSKPHWCQWLIWLRWRHRWFRPETLVDLASRAGLVTGGILSFETGPPRRTSLGYLFQKPYQSGEPI